MYERHALKYLFHVALDILDWNAATVTAETSLVAMRLSELLDALLGVLNHLFEVLIAIFEDKILRRLPIITPRVVDVKHANHILTVFELVENFEFPGDIFASLLGPLNGHRLLRILVISFKYIA